jgi:hypothetical protein
MRYYTASKTRDKGRDRYSVIFRHPVRLDPTTGRPGRRVRRGLGTSDGQEADALVAELDMLLSTEEYWNLSARGTAEGRFDPRVVSAFFDGMELATLAPSVVLRDGVIPLPTTEQGYRRVLLLGTTGAGKTTVVRQLLGTDPVRDRFPSTSTAKTTVADTEIVLAEGPFRAVVTFCSRDEVVDHLVDCASKAALAAFRGAGDKDLRGMLLDHENQRFRFSYVLGRHRDAAESVSESSAYDGFDDLDDLDDFTDVDELGGPDDGQAGPEQEFDAEPEGLAGIDLVATATVVDNALATLKALIAEHGDATRAQLNVANEDDERVAREILDEELDKILRADERFNAIIDGLLDEIEKRFDALSVGMVKRDRQGWPSTWAWDSEDRVAFLRAVNRFSSNYAPMFGHLLSPLVNGIRVAGPFRPTWLRGPAPKLVLIDGEGLGHTPKSSAALPTAVAKTIEEVDAVLLVDDASQPVQAAPASAIRSILTSGNTDKLIFCFTHFDEVTGDNLQTPSDRARHILASAENLLATLREDFGPRSERALRRRLGGNRVFLADIDKPLDPAAVTGRRSIDQLQKMLTVIEQVTDRPELGPGRPVYDKTNLVLAVTAAVASFHRRWRAILGVTSVPDVDKAHWTRVKALNRRYAEGTADFYDKLRPASDLRELLKDEIYKTLEAPLRWTGGRPTDDVIVTRVIDEFSQAISKRLPAPIRERLSVRPQRSWQDSYSLSGSGSTFVRARRISDDILGRNVPVPGAAPSPDQNDFLHAVIGSVEEAAQEVDVELT